MALNRDSLIGRFPDLTMGMTVYSSDGEKLGDIISLADDHFVVQKGMFFPKDFTLRYDDIQDVRDRKVHVSLGQSDLSGWKDESYSGWQQTDDINYGNLNAQPRDEYKDRYSNWSSNSEQISVPVSEEELQTTKTSKQAGEVKVRKVVHTELRHFNVPVMREEIRVERVPSSGKDSSSISSSDSAFEEKTINVPVMEEEVSVTKRPVVKEEVRVSKERVTEEKPVEGEVRKEEVRIEGEDELKRRKAG